MSSAPHRCAVGEWSGWRTGAQESPGETRLREALRWMGLVAIPQFRIEDGPFLALVDFIVEEYQLAIEFDGFVKYGRLDRLAQSTRADIVMAEKIREDHIRELGHRFLRVIWRDMDELHALRRCIDSIIQRAAMHRSA
jgi:very-short-patch-repair endonuclease